MNAGPMDLVLPAGRRPPGEGGSDGAASEGPPAGSGRSLRTPETFPHNGPLCYQMPMRNRDPSPLGQRGLPPTGGISSGEKMRLAVLFIFALLVTTLALTIDRGGSSVYDDEELPPVSQDEPIDDIPVAVSAWEPPIELANQRIDESTPEGRAVIAYDAISAMAVAVRNRSHVNFKYDASEEGSYRRISASELAVPAAAPGLRGRPVELVGMTRDVKPINALERYRLDEDVFVAGHTLWTGLLDCDGQLVRFLHIGDGRQSIAMPAPGTRLKVFGVFHRVIDEVIDGEVLTMPFVLGTKLTPAIPRIEPQPITADLKTLIEFSEQEMIERSAQGLQLGSPHRDPTFYRILGHVRGEAEDYAARLEELPVLSGLEPVQEPDRFRLRPVRVEGAVAYMRRESFEYEDMHPDDAPYNGYWHAIVSRWETDKHTPISVVIPDDLVTGELREWAELTPRERREKDSPVLEGHGLFYRLHGFQGRGDRARKLDGRAVKYPMVILAAAPSISIQPRDDRRSDTSFMLGFGGVGLLIAGSLSMLLWRDRKRSAKHEAHMREERLKRRRKSSAGGMPPLGAKPGAQMPPQGNKDEG